MEKQTKLDVLDPKTEVLGRHFVEASAGTGKTFAIEKIFARLLLEKEFSVGEVLLVTFTRAAARELKERIHANIASLPKSRKVEEVLVEMDRAAVFTIHGFCHRMLSEFSFEAGQTPTLPDPDNSDWTRGIRAAILRVLRSPLEGFDPVQLDLLLRSFGNSIDRLTSALVAAHEGEELPNFSEMQELFGKKLPKISSNDLLDALQEASGSYKGLANRSGALHPHFIKQAELFDSVDNFSLLLSEDSFLHKLTEENRKARAKGEISPLLLELQEAVLPIIEEARSPEKTFLRLAHLINKELDSDEEELLAPDDLLKRMRAALDRPAFCEAIQKRYRAAIIDEFQDTDLLQWEIFSKLFLDAESFIVVGDPKQSIYSFRGADLRVYFQAKEAMGKEAFATLNTNYRSKGELVSKLNHLFVEGGNWLDEEGLPLSYRPVESGGASGGNFTFLEAEKEEDLFPFIAKTALSRPFSDVAILVKDRFQASRVESYLTGCQIPFRAKGMSHIAETLAFDFFVDLFSALKDLTRLGNVKRFLAHPFVGYTDQQLATSDLTDELSYLHYLRSISSKRGFFLDQLVKNPWVGKTIYEGLSLEEYGHIMQIADLLLEAKTSDPARFLQEVKHEHVESDMRFKAARLADENSVSIMTMHMSKGLEFSVVFALNLAAKESKESPEAMRGLYVALTRAKEEVYFPLIEGKPTLGSRFFAKIKESEKFSKIKLEGDQPVPIFEEKGDQLMLHEFTRRFPEKYVHSFTSLAKKHIFDGESRRPGEGELPAGADVGIYLHALFEKVIDEGLYQKKNFSYQVEMMTREGAYADHADEVAKMVTAAFSISLEKDLKLAQIPPPQMVTEMEFLTPNLKGFADLIFEDGGALYLADWKSNYLGDRKEDYQEENLRKAMEEHDYFLQAKIYGEALSRYAAIVGKKFGGIYYIFLRGLKWDLGVYRCNILT